eukprot:TRINITY_DN7991_c2_g1_i1.p1 TRINITY_DN7991_c2_g1~~TRINITY_DN7991_c2_g1_i1.p1  ORF type:complete len:291 (-),score=41.51 TRINITY_DN7991_c2_g1_i1:372-1178(-)
MEASTMLEAAQFLQIGDLARWRAVNLATKEAFDVEGDLNVWQSCALNEFGSKVITSYELYASPQRQRFFKFFSMLSHANYTMSSTPFIVEDTEEAYFIEQRLRSAVSACSAHRAASNQDAQVLLGDFSLQNSKFGTMFRFGGEDMPPTLAGLPPGVLEIRLFWDGCALKSCARYAVERNDTLEEYAPAAGVQLTLNIDSAEIETLLSFRGIPLILDGYWRSSRGGYYSDRFNSKSDRSVLCVMSLLNAEPPRGRPSLMNALKLEPNER